MDLNWSEEQRELQASVREFLERTSSIVHVREVVESDEGFDRAVWQRMAGELGLQGLGVPEEHGGGGFGFAESVLVLEELGRVLYPGPFLASAVIAAAAIAASGDEEAQGRLLPQIADGSLIATLALFEGPYGDDIATTATADGDRVRVTGTKRYVLSGGIADLLLVVARSGDGLSLVAVPADAPGVTRSSLTTTDRTRRLATIELDGAAGQAVGTLGAADEAIAHTRTVALAGLAAEQVGAARVCLERTVDYVGLREQFGRKIGSFQAVKHRLADVLVAVENASSALTLARAAISDSSSEAYVAGLTAGAMCSEASLFAAQQMLQLHGGIGFTEEHDAHLYVRRAKSSHAVFGEPHEHREALAVALAL
ncbi:acyl-CoA dehydrogenase family protein [Microbacterium sp. No. 7]|uniref:acyl-CoA dehydrogenase family protein n=1 Tax=Microbacterium sp. No. 7 TaxID=1714373 RepID=UPI0006D2805B|nr:acyl-CoA dehydrogenase family protein [Microbacterium sp. No. 7]ALJ18863.1 hypothetical protein AOA12_02630 [Microbacterium sp. No. 7]